jgi:capsular polysaccharide biosynthesis protein
VTDGSATTTEGTRARQGRAPLQAVGTDRPGRRIMPWEAITVVSAANLIAAVIISIVAAAGAGVLVLRQEPVYQSQATLLIDQPSAIALQLNDGVLVKLSLLRNKYVALATSSQLLVPASEATGIPIAELATVRTFAPPNSLLVVPVAQGPDRLVTQTLANTMADELSKYVTKEQTDAGIAPPDQITLTTIQPAGVGAQVRPTTSHARSVALTTGGATLLGAYVVLQLATGRRRLQHR